MKVDLLEAERDRSKVAVKIVELSDQRLSTQENRKSKYVALKIGTGPYSNAVCVHSNRVSFLIRSTDLRDRIRAAGFKLEPVPNTTPMNEHKFLIPGLGLSEIQAHEALFREIVKESSSLILDRRPRKN